MTSGPHRKLPLSSFVTWAILEGPKEFTPTHAGHIHSRWTCTYSSCGKVDMTTIAFVRLPPRSAARGSLASS